MDNTDVFLGLHDFLERMRQPSAADFVKSIKSFIVSFSNHAPDPERDSAAVQDFLANMEAAFKAHPLWAGCSEEELESAGEGLEKYVMTKLFTRVFASLPDDVKLDEQLSEKMALIQQFIRPENLDIKPNFQNETSWLLAQKELQKINMYKAPRDKLVCILNCCKVISNLLLNASIASNENPPGADEFLPVLIYVTIKANPPQLHSNLLYIQRYRSQSRLVAEASYYFTNMLSAESFISNIDANALSMEEAEFEKNMESARALLSGLSSDIDGLSDQLNQIAGQTKSGELVESKHQRQNFGKGKESATTMASKEIPSAKDQSLMDKVPSLSDLENKGVSMLLKEDQASQVFREYPFLFAHVGDLTINDVEDLLNNYKQLVFKYVCLSKGLGCNFISPSSLHTQILHAESEKKIEDSGAVEQKDGLQKDTGILQDERNTDSNTSKDEAMPPLDSNARRRTGTDEGNVESTFSPDEATPLRDEGHNGTSLS
ncbi:LOW QUALITY PROTEIN: vacuolar protein sorting-associated protein 9A-like [Tripterygium wilfordii]|uniref:LOW QUALITY PROTEIN: vacuolar protein sorting-associated protein 9A-like n=1 Tax=Tripterygium wilfordii TaxID=458696 RepID=UPI0018F80437|nr:LOW QUALITY PROTEIN: vacuolar protein sorting-associated protein 9A-like [Tripterygium wilfordii]